MNLTFSGKTVMVTGAGGGSGKAIAKAFLDAGARVVAADLTCPDWKSPSDFIYPAAMDVSDEAAVDRTVELYAGRLGGNRYTSQQRWHRHRIPPFRISSWISGTKSLW